MRPGTNIVISEIPPVRSAPTDTGVWFVAGFSERGSATEAMRIESMSDFERLLGNRVSYSFLYDAAETYFREGGGTLYVSRVFGPTPTVATVDLLDGSAGVVFSVNAKSPGSWGAALNIAVLAGDIGGEFKLEVSDDVAGILETSPSLPDKAAAIAWAENSDYIVLVSGASDLDPAVAAAASLVGGDDDRTNATDATWEAALGRFVKDLGPGQVSYPGRTTGQAHADLLEHAAINNRVALLDSPDTTTKATLITTATTARTANARRGALYAPWVRIPGIAPGTTRLVPPSAVVAGRIARIDSLGSPNVPAAGDNGQSLFGIGVSQPAWTDADREALNNAGVNVLRMMFGNVRIYGWRSLANPATDINWLNFGNVRLIMGIAAEADVIGEQFMFEEIDGQGRTLGRFGASLSGMLLSYWQAGSLFGQTPDEAYIVDVGAQVNTPTTLADGELRAVLGLRCSPFAEMVTIEIVKTPITEELI